MSDHVMLRDTIPHHIPPHHRHHSIPRCITPLHTTSHTASHTSHHTTLPHGARHQTTPHDIASRHVTPHRTISYSQHSSAKAPFPRPVDATIAIPWVSGLFGGRNKGRPSSCLSQGFRSRESPSNDSPPSFSKLQRRGVARMSEAGGSFCGSGGADALPACSRIVHPLFSSCCGST